MDGEYGEDRVDREDAVDGEGRAGWMGWMGRMGRTGYWNGLPYPPPGDLPNPGIEPRSPTLQADSLPAEPPGKPKNTGVGSISLLQGIFPTQE